MVFSRHIRSGSGVVLGVERLGTAEAGCYQELGPTHHGHVRLARAPPNASISRVELPSWFDNKNPKLRSWRTFSGTCARAFWVIIAGGCCLLVLGTVHPLQLFIYPRLAQEGPYYIVIVSPPSLPEGSCHGCMLQRAARYSRGENPSAHSHIFVIPLPCLCYSPVRRVRCVLRVDMFLSCLESGTLNSKKLYSKIPQKLKQMSS